MCHASLPRQERKRTMCASRRRCSSEKKRRLFGRNLALERVGALGGSFWERAVPSRRVGALGASDATRRARASRVAPSPPARLWACSCFPWVGRGVASRAAPASRRGPPRGGLSRRSRRGGPPPRGSRRRARRRRSRPAPATSSWRVRAGTRARSARGAVVPRRARARRLPPPRVAVVVLFFLVPQKIKNHTSWTRRRYRPVLAPRRRERGGRAAHTPLARGMRTRSSRRRWRPRGVR